MSNHGEIIGPKERWKDTQEKLQALKADVESFKAEVDAASDAKKAKILKKAVNKKKEIDDQITKWKELYKDNDDVMKELDALTKEVADLFKDLEVKNYVSKLTDLKGRLEEESTEDDPFKDTVTSTIKDSTKIPKVTDIIPPEVLAEEESGIFAQLKKMAKPIMKIIHQMRMLFAKMSVSFAGMNPFMKPEERKRAKAEALASMKEMQQQYEYMYGIDDLHAKFKDICKGKNLQITRGSNDEEAFAKYREKYKAWASNRPGATEDQYIAELLNEYTSELPLDPGKKFVTTLAGVLEGREAPEAPEMASILGNQTEIYKHQVLISGNTISVDGTSYELEVVKMKLFSDEEGKKIPVEFSSATILHNKSLLNASNKDLLVKAKGRVAFFSKEIPITLKGPALRTQLSELAGGARNIVPLAEDTVAGIFSYRVRLVKT